MNRFALGMASALAMWIGSAVGGEAANLVARVDISSQTMTVVQDGEIIRRWPVSTARRGFFTPRGVYRPTRLHRMWFSSKYENAPMPWSIFFHGGFAIHGTEHVRSLGHPASHGCVRLDPDNAAELYWLVEQEGARNTRIVLVD